MGDTLYILIMYYTIHIFEIRRVHLNIYVQIDRVQFAFKFQQTIRTASEVDFIIPKYFLF